MFSEEPCDHVLLFPPPEGTEVFGADARSVFKEEAVAESGPPDESHIFEEDRKSGYNVWIE